MAKRVIKPKKAVAKKKPARSKAVKRPARKPAKKKTLKDVSKPYLLAAGAGVLLLLTLTGVIFSQQASAPDGKQSSAIVNVDNTTNLPEFAKNHPLSGVQTGTYTLKRGETPVLEKAESEWVKFARVGEWLYFHDLNPTSSTDFGSKRTYDLYAYNFRTNQYVNLGSIDAPENTEIVKFYQLGDYLYMYVAGYKSEEVTYRCLINTEQACGEPAVFTTEKGRIYQGGGRFYSIMTQVDGGASASTVNLLNDKGEKIKHIGDYSSSQQESEEVVTIDGNGFIWVAKFEQAGDNSKLFVRLAGLDESGLRIKELLPGNVPIKNFEIAAWVNDNSVLLYNKKSAYVYDTINNTFENIDNLAEIYSKDWNEEYIRRLLELAAPYTLDYAAGDYDN